MSDRVRIFIDGEARSIPAGISVAAALLNAGVVAVRTSVAGEPRAPLCGMGSCHECRVAIDGVAHRRSCLIVATDGMRVQTR